MVDFFLVRGVRRPRRAGGRTDLCLRGALQMELRIRVHSLGLRVWG